MIHDTIQDLTAMHWRTFSNTIYSYFDIMATRRCVWMDSNYSSAMCSAQGCTSPKPGKRGQGQAVTHKRTPKNILLVNCDNSRTGQAQIYGDNRYFILTKNFYILRNTYQVASQFPMYIYNTKTPNVWCFYSTFLFPEKRTNFIEPVA